MPKSLKLTFLSALFLVAIFQTSNAAFPKEKQITSTVFASESNTSATAEMPESKAEVKQEIKSLKKEASHLHFGGDGGKSKTLAVVLALLVGGLGIHSLYMGQKVKGFAQMGLTVLGIVLYIAGIASFISGTGAAIPVTALIGLLLIFGVSIWAFVDFIRILTGGLAPEEGFDS